MMDHDAPGLRPKIIGASVRRVEDRRLLTGQGSFAGDRTCPGALHLAFRRSASACSVLKIARGRGCWASLRSSRRPKSTGW
jgi:carbon-monoxide dehydrogenase large subunit